MAQFLRGDLRQVPQMRMPSATACARLVSGDGYGYTRPDVLRQQLKVVDIQKF
jgi:hypothetical protein